MQRVGSLIAIRPEHIEEYKRLHAKVWPDVLAMISACNIANYSIFLREPENLLFSYFEYNGVNLAADMAQMAADRQTQRWWALTTPLQHGLDSRAAGEWWAPMEEVFHHR